MVGSFRASINQVQSVSSFNIVFGSLPTSILMIEQNFKMASCCWIKYGRYGTPYDTALLGTWDFLKKFKRKTEKSQHIENAQCHDPIKQFVN